MIYLKNSTEEQIVYLPKQPAIITEEEKEMEEGNE